MATIWVTLECAEIYFIKAGQRAFDVTVDEGAVLSHPDLVAEVGPTGDRWRAQHRLPLRRQQHQGK
jgi:hypothetical protein